MYVSLSSNGFWILRVTIYSRIHKSYAPYFCFPFFFPMRSLLLYLRPGKLRWWWVFTHPLNYTLSAQLKNPGGPSAEYYQNLGSRISKKPSNRIWTKKSPDFFRAFTRPRFLLRKRKDNLVKRDSILCLFYQYSLALCFQSTASTSYHKKLLSPGNLDLCIVSYFKV